MSRSSSLDSTWRAVLMHDPCVYCGDPATGLDHIVPRTRNGLNGWSNRAPACRNCDQWKAHQSLVLFLFERHTGLLPLITVRRPRRFRPDLPPPRPMRTPIWQLIGYQMPDSLTA